MGALARDNESTEIGIRVTRLNRGAPIPQTHEISGIILADSGSGEKEDGNAGGKRRRIRISSRCSEGGNCWILEFLNLYLFPRGFPYRRKIVSSFGYPFPSFQLFNKSTRIKMTGRSAYSLRALKSALARISLARENEFYHANCV